MFRNTFKVKCPASGIKSVFSLSEVDERESGNSLLCWLLYVFWFLEMKHPVSGAKKLMLYHIW